MCRNIVTNASREPERKDSRITLDRPSISLVLVCSASLIASADNEDKFYLDDASERARLSMLARRPRRSSGEELMECLIEEESMIVGIVNRGSTARMIARNPPVTSVDYAINAYDDFERRAI